MGDAAATARCQPVLIETDKHRRRRAVVDIVIPVFNEADELADSVHRVHAYLTARFPLDWMITIADNASTDGTWEIASRLARELDGVQAMRLERKGRGRAVRAAWLASPAPVVAYMDVDLSTDLDALLPLVAPLVSGHSDLAIGTRLASSARVVRGPKREVISRTYNLLLRTTLRSGFSDAQCGFKAARSEVVRPLMPMIEDDGWFFDTELLVLAERNGLRIHEVPVDWVDDPESRVEILSTARADLRGIWRLLRRLGPVDGFASTHRDDVPGGLGSQLVRFASIGVVSTVVFAALFWILAGPLGGLAANVVALASCSVANTAANRRLAFSLRGRAGRIRHYTSGLVVNTLPLALTIATLLVLQAVSSPSRGIELVAVTGANAAATIARFILLREWVFRPAPGRDH